MEALGWRGCLEPLPFSFRPASPQSHLRAIVLMLSGGAAVVVHKRLSPAAPDKIARRIWSTTIPTMEPSTNKIKIAIGSYPRIHSSAHTLVTDNWRETDRGGTFTDIWASLPGHPDVVLKLLSVDPSNYNDAPTEGTELSLRVA